MGKAELVRQNQTSSIHDNGVVEGERRKRESRKIFDEIMHRYFQIW